MDEAKIVHLENRRNKKTMKVNGRNYLVIATFPGIKGEAGNIPPLEIWVMYKEAVRCSYIQYIDSFLDENAAFDNCQYWSQSCRKLLLSDWITRINVLRPSWVDAVRLYAKFWCSTQTTHWCSELFGQCRRSFKISLTRSGGFTVYCWIECLRKQHWQWKICHDAVTRAVQ